MIKVLENISLKEHNSFGIEARARFWIEASDRLLLINELKLDTYQDLPLLILGSGSNVLFRQDYPGVIVHSANKQLSVVSETEDQVLIEVGAGMIWDEFVNWSVERKLWGIENLSLIPGTVGAAPVQNIGAYGSEIKDTISAVSTIDIRTGTSRRFKPDDCGFAYRWSIFKELNYASLLVWSVTFQLSKIPTPILSYPDLEKLKSKIQGASIKEIRDEVIRIRRKKLPDPEKTGNAGSFFKNPILSATETKRIKSEFPQIPVYPSEDGAYFKVAAGWMIDHLGWKSKREGDASVHENQALVLVNDGSASGEDIFMLAKNIQQSVLNHFGVTLIPEVRIIPDL